MTFQIRYRGRFPVQQKRADGTLGCRGCGELIPKGRQTWCSHSCYATYSPVMVISAVKERDKGVCQICGVDIFATLRERFGVRAHFRKGGRAEYDHIVPMCEGGLTVLTNLRTLCRPCHLSETKKLTTRRALARKAL